ncbi:hypothetical protein, partial [Streptomyces fuscigenes]|uniref:hypothetical protein n=1 Tax=Streptomyces fuscigenes TaxID=1528880 RepID=UPI001F1FAB2E
KKYGSRLDDMGKWYDQTSLEVSVPSYVKGVKTMADLKGKASAYERGRASRAVVGAVRPRPVSEPKSKSGAPDAGGTSSLASRGRPADASEVSAAIGATV